MGDRGGRDWRCWLVASHPPPNLPPGWEGDELRKEWVLRWVGSCLRRNDGGGAGMMEGCRNDGEGEWRGRSGRARLLVLARGVSPPT